LETKYKLKFLQTIPTFNKIIASAKLYHGDLQFLLSFLWGYFHSKFKVSSISLSLVMARRK